jgi:tetratricopeptide (TPR) repeat protein
MLRRIIFVLAMLAPLHLRAADPSSAELVDNGHFKRAQLILADRLKSNPNDAAAHYRMSKVALAFGHWDDAIQHSEKAVSLDTKNADYQAQLAEALVSKLSENAQLGFFDKLSLSRRYRKEADLALQLDPNNVEASSDLMEYLQEAPGMAGGDKKKAAELADHMVQVKPVHGYLMKYDMANKEKRTTDADHALQEAIRADPKSYDARIAAANFYLQQGAGAFAQSEQLARAAVALAPDRAAAYNILATLYAQQSRWTDLDSLLKDAQHAVPDNAGPFYQAAKTILLSNQGVQFPRAEQYLRTYLGQPPEGGEPSLTAAHWRLGLLLEKEGHKDQAKQELQAAVTLDPNFEPARKDLKRLQ